MLARRDLLQFASLALSGAVFPRMRGLFDDSQSKGNAVDLPEQYPAYPADLIKTIVTVSHFDLNKLKDLVDPHPHLVKAAWEWGFGDWETPLGAACHMGRRDIAEYLLAKGARRRRCFPGFCSGTFPWCGRAWRVRPGSSA